jgi:hypothetical protein
MRRANLKWSHCIKDGDAASIRAVKICRNGTQIKIEKEQSNEPEISRITKVADYLAIGRQTGNNGQNSYLLMEIW